MTCFSDCGIVNFQTLKTKKPAIKRIYFITFAKYCQDTTWKLCDLLRKLKCCALATNCHNEK